MSTIVSLSGRRLVSSNGFTGLSIARLNQISSHHLSGATFQYNLSQYSEKSSLSNGQPISFRRQIFYTSFLELKNQKEVPNFKERNPSFDYLDKEPYFELLSKYVEDPSIEPVGLEDYKNACWMASTKEDLVLIDKMVLAILRRQPMDPRWSAILMRLYFKFDDVDRAYNNFKDVEKFLNFFDSPSSCKLLMMMLYLEGKYEEVVEIFEMLEQSIGKSSKPSKIFHTYSLIAIAALAKQLKPGCLERGLSLVDRSELTETRIRLETGYSSKLSKKKARGLNNIGYYRFREVILLAYMAIQENQPKAALDLLSSKTYVINSSSARDLKGLALLQLGRYEDIVDHLRFNLLRNTMSKWPTKELIHRDVHEEYKNCLNNIEDVKLRQNFKEILDEIEHQKLFCSKDLESHLFETFNTKEESMMQWNEDEGHEVEMKSLRRNRAENKFGLNQ